MNDPAAARQARLVAALRDHQPAAADVVLIETHISYVLLSGGYAYKIKKALDLGFLDFTSLERRRFYCGEELRLNRRTAPGLYREVVALTGSAQRPRLGGDGPALDYAVKMRRFPQDDLAVHVLQRGALTPAHVDRIARDVALFHGRIPAAAPDGPYGSAEEVRRPVRDNFTALRSRPAAPGELQRLAALEDWSDQTWAQRRPLLDERRRAGCIRECHGDLHLGNLVLLDGAFTPFDAIEFNDRLRWIDVINEAAFLAMDLEARGHRDLAWRFLNAYLEWTGDYAAAPLLAYYQAYRAMVRAKVARLRLAQDDVPAGERANLEPEFDGYLALADRYTRPRAVLLCITHGLSGSGKTAMARLVAGRMGAFHLRSDVERKRLAGLSPCDASGSAPAEGLYSGDATDRTYARLATLAAGLLHAGYPVIVDATFLDPARRAQLRRTAVECGAPCVILAARAPAPTLRRRVAARAATGDASEADRAVLERQLGGDHELGAAELAAAVVVDTTRHTDSEWIVARIAAVADTTDA